MAHHHGMTLGALGNVLFENLHVRWFHTDPHVRTVDLLLNERIPWELPPEIARVEVREPQATPESAIPGLYSWTPNRSEEHTSELQSLMRISYAVYCLKKKKITHTHGLI